MDIDELNNETTSLIFIINESCFNCDGNLPLFNKMSRILAKDGVRIFGIVPDELSTMINHSENRKLDFKLYAPKDLKKFKKEFRLKKPDDQIMIHHRGKVIAHVSGRLDGHSYTGILRKVKQLIKQKK